MAHMMSPSDELRSAATLIRLHADGVTSGPWKSEATVTHGHRVRTVDEASWIAWTGDYGEEKSARDADWIALMHPGVGTALAELLDTAAEYVGDDAVAHPTHLVRALAVARQINGGQP
ncbi:MULTISPECIES: hypothetical protein [unclassified Streptomyces]|uniref:hypothetical protein n=1 Tax=unclassified Streptomyces TaxID=2593676 RepID=UPI001F1FF2EC|nr:MULTISPECIES: hypothetical protein [unclassified Streptomyces]MCF0086630.1 hypothetical protein [Streptomyces sp. MH192]MCF0098784.1 hypothetical protein [Streptomyces sp. MH191]